MSASPTIWAGITAAGLSLLIAGVSHSQERELELQRGTATQDRDADANRADSGQIDRNATGQHHTAQFRGTQSDAAGQKQSLQNYLASCLLQTNKAEVELGQLAQRQAEHPQVKQFAERMVQDHQQVVQKLQPLAGTQGAQSATTGQLDAPSNRTANESLTTSRTASGQSGALNELKQINQQITQRYYDAVREDLQQKQGTEFDKCYLATQIGGHMYMLASLEVIEQQGPDQLRQIAQQAQPKVQQHLEQAKQLMKQVEGNSSATSSRAERQTPRTQR